MLFNNTPLILEVKKISLKSGEKPGGGDGGQLRWVAE
jgi:hypothetical protein